MPDNKEKPKAFPVAETEWHLSVPGMDLRDWFAGQAMAAYISMVGVDVRPTDAVRFSYYVADSMMKEREDAH